MMPVKAVALPLVCLDSAGVWLSCQANTSTWISVLAGLFRVFANQVTNKVVYFVPIACNSCKLENLYSYSLELEGNYHCYTTQSQAYEHSKMENLVYNVQLPHFVIFTFVQGTIASVCIKLNVRVYSN